MGLEGMNGLTPAQRLRYSRQIRIEEIGDEGQQRLIASKVLIVGCGALGSMVAMQLAGAGVGCLAIADFDNVDISNLQRQFFFTTEESGKSKAEVLADRIRGLNPEIKVVVLREMMTRAKAGQLFGDYDFIVDATDNPESKKMIGEVSSKLGKPCCIGGVNGFSGQVMVFQPGDSRFEEYFGESSADGVLPCSVGGVLGPTAALCASLQAMEVIKYLVGENPKKHLIYFNLLDSVFRVFD